MTNYDVTIKLRHVIEILKGLESVTLAFSGGVDSSLLAAIAKEALNKNRILLVTAKLDVMHECELLEAKRFAEELSLKHRIIDIDAFSIKYFKDNTPDRCYYCKKAIFEKIRKIAYEENGNYIVVDGTNSDDTFDYRPGRKALNELGIISPLKLAGITKEEIRILANRYNISAAEKPANSCLATRIQFEETITKRKLNRIQNAETKILDLGFSQVRVRSHGNLARLEFIESEIEKAWDKKNILNQICIKAGFNYAAIDCVGYLTGSMNKGLSDRYIEKYKI